MDEQDEPSLAGMTVNERLFHTGILDRWDVAVRQRDRTVMIALLEQVEVADPHVTADTVLANPQTYGFGAGGLSLAAMIGFSVGMSRYDLTEFEWRVIEPLLPNKSGGVPLDDDRRVLNGIFGVLRSGAPWRDPPER